MYSIAWLTGMLTATGVNDPKNFPKTVDDLLNKGKPPKPFNKDQWRAVIKALTGGSDEPPKRPKYPPREET